MNNEGTITRIRLKKSEAVKQYLDPKILQNSIYVIDIVNQETTVKIWDILSKTGSQNSLSASTISKLVKISISKFNELTHTTIHPDDLTLLSDVESMYRNIWSDSTKNTKKCKWASIKKTTVNNGPPSGPDLKILSTAAKLAQNGVVEILTFDNDFILFADEIMNQFGISIKNGWLL